MRIERRIDDETRELLAEGRRRTREYEGMASLATDENGNVIGFLVNGKIVSGCVGTHKLPGAGLPMAEAVKVAAAASEDFGLYLPNQMERDGLDAELRDLLRDAELMEKHERVKYDV